jgi:hypothetical protein
MAEHSLLVPFLNNNPVYCYGCELGLQVLAPMLRKKKKIKGYFRTENEEQIRLCCYRMNYELKKCKPWYFKGKETGWIWMVMKRNDSVCLDK